MLNVLILLIHSAKLAKNLDIDKDGIFIQSVLLLNFVIFVNYPRF